MTVGGGGRCESYPSSPQLADPAVASPTLVDLADIPNTPFLGANLRLLLEKEAERDYRDGRGGEGGEQDGDVSIPGYNDNDDEAYEVVGELQAKVYASVT
eukprot:1192856-Prorocentrum_minimum.AAC.1